MNANYDEVAIMLKAIEILGNVSTTMLHEMGFSDEAISRGLEGGYLTIKDGEVTLTDKGRDYVRSVAREYETMAFRRLYGHYKSKPRSLERDVAIAEYGSSYLEHVNYNDPEVLNEVLSTCLRLARFGFEANSPELARRYGVKAFLMGMRVGRYDAALEGLSYAVSRIDNILTIYPYIKAAAELSDEVVSRYPREYASLMLRTAEALMNSGYVLETLRYVDQGLRLFSQSPNDEETCYLIARLMETKAAAQINLGRYDEANTTLANALDLVGRCLGNTGLGIDMQISLRDKRGVLNYLTGNFRDAAGDFMFVLEKSLARGNRAFASSAVHNYIKSRALMSTDCSDYAELINPVLGVSLQDSIKYFSSVKDAGNEYKVRILLSILLLSTRRYSEAIEVASPVNNEPGRFVLELARALQGLVNEIPVEYNDRRLADLAHLVNSALRILRWRARGNVGVVHGDLADSLMRLLHCQVLKALLVIS
ncbi:hypothetical protein [Vulcanisaeta thermophila]|uniref:hypothetical protein n=1 Tax=Vulcanisaeta thermophila TaxID=867917 RepID=UPI0008538A27|nr:hypothetical protein [Vulcanisaeta thermophila]